MDNEEYSKEKITSDDLKEFASVAIKFVKEKFRDGPPAVIIFSQGGALHYAYCNGLISTSDTGLKDIDIWVFYDVSTYPKIKNYYGQTYHRDYTGSNGKFGQNPKETKYIGRRMDILVRAIKFTNLNDFNTMKKDIIKYFHSGNKKRQSQLDKAGFVVYPDNFTGKNLWPPK